jgi:hypothetical protein
MISDTYVTDTTVITSGNPDTAPNHKAVIAQLELALAAVGAGGYLTSEVDEQGWLHIKIEVRY